MKKNTEQKIINPHKLGFLICSVFFCLTLISCTSKKDKIACQNVDQFLEENSFQGSVLVGRGNKILFSKGYGLEDPKDKSKHANCNSEKTVFEAGSITKQMTAAAIMQLEQQHKLSIDDKLSKYFPEYKHGEEITIKMLLNMHSGLTDHINSADEFFPKNIYRHIENRQIANKSLDSEIVLTYFYDAPLLAKPDSTYFYCNTNYYLLAKIIEQVSGLSYQEYIQKNIFEPCKMTSSNLQFQKTDAVGYDYRGRYYSIPASLALGCGDLNSNSLDLFKWNTRFHNGKVVSKKSYKKMTKGEGYGFGLYCGPESYFHSGTTNVFNSYIAYYPKKKVSVIVLENCPISKQNATLIAGNVYKTFYPPKVKKPAKDKETNQN